MTGREKIEAAFEADGTPEIAAVICYEGIYVRDHWDQLTGLPWWAAHSPDVEVQIALHRDLIEKTGQDWFVVPTCQSRRVRESLAIEVRDEGVFRVDGATGRETRLNKPRIGGWQGPEPDRLKAHVLLDTAERIDERIGTGAPFDSCALRASGCCDLADALLGEFGAEKFPISHISSPLWACYGLWGFEGMMTRVRDRPDLIAHACDRFADRSCSALRAAAELGAEAIWIEECMTDMVSPDTFESLNLPGLRRLIDAIRSLGMKSIYYYCGNPAGKWDLVLSAGADAISLEESKKGFRIDIEDTVERTGGRFVVLGNLDAVGVLQNGSDERLRAEIKHQLAAGRKNGSRFIMSLGSPVTPPTPFERVRLYCDMVRELGRG